MALNLYRWKGLTWQIDDKDLRRYPGAVLIEQPKADSEKKKTNPANKSRRAPKDK